MEDIKPSVQRKILAFVLLAWCDFALFYVSGASFTYRVGVYARLWGFAAARFFALSFLALYTLGDLESVLFRFIATLSLLPAVYETGTKLFYDGFSDCGLSSDWWCWIMGSGASVAAALFWEITIPDADEAVSEKKSKQKSRVLFMRVLRLFRPDLPLLLGGLVFLSLAVFCEMFIPYYTGKVIDILGGQYQANEFTMAVIFMGLFSLGGSVCAGGRGGLLLCAVGSFTSRIKLKLFETLTKQEIGFFETIKTGEITSRLSKDTNSMGMTVCLNMNVLLRTFVKTVGMISLMMSLSWKLTFLVLMETPVAGAIQNVYDTYYQRLSLAVQDAMAHANDAANEVVSNIHVVRSFNAEKHEANRYNQRLKTIHELKTRRDTVRAIYLLVRRLTGLGMQVLMLYYGRLFIQRGQMTAGNLVSFIMYQSDLGDNIRTLTYIFGDMLNSVGAAGKVFEYLDRKPKISAEGTLAPDQIKGNIQFSHVNFAYPSCPSKSVLQDFTLELKPGQMTAFVGPSGEGKSTCASLLQRFYEPQSGEILFNKEPLKSYEHHYLHKKIVVVSQEPVLFTGSIKDNISYGMKACTDKEIEEAARKANAHDFILQLEKGYDTEVGEGGGQLAKSERQRIAIARALVRQPQVLILDEITSSLDDDSEKKVQQALAQCPNQTLLVIAHRLKTIEGADQIVVIGNGRVQERGTHQELMDMKGHYYRLREKLSTNGHSP
ncbi:LOW QUALITY PROTEIN: antigen peptide transporter 2a [Boleophthalmus pectinirostris]|uniref:LOW QUALITY PROTEIN: antigen peptide transporter 2a n=1 Tax=Boleophthalmus pectinirostris TaxID=150288 RepID=UPI00242C03AE|nr:LOW QUALITY PROTEIN: antigen peptide transporter 2a [Boleophthalmus pectinirostris]